MRTMLGQTMTICVRLRHRRRGKGGKGEGGFDFEHVGHAASLGGFGSSERELGLGNTRCQGLTGRVHITRQAVYNGRPRALWTVGCFALLGATAMILLL